MAEEKHYSTIIDDVSHDDITVMRTLLHNVRGLSPISMAPVLEPALADDEY